MIGGTTGLDLKVKIGDRRGLRSIESDK